MDKKKRFFDPKRVCGVTLEEVFNGNDPFRALAYRNREKYLTASNGHNALACYYNNFSYGLGRSELVHRDSKSGIINTTQFLTGYKYDPHSDEWDFSYYEILYINGNKDDNRPENLIVVYKDFAKYFELIPKDDFTYLRSGDGKYVLSFNRASNRYAWELSYIQYIHKFINTPDIMPTGVVIASAKDKDYGSEYILERYWEQRRIESIQKIFGLAIDDNWFK